jgi:uncharacterized membrane protein
MITDVLAFALSASLVIGYYLVLWLRGQAVSVHAFNAVIRKRWLIRIITTHGLNILAVQTLRNSVMAANFMASTSILLIVGALNLSDKMIGPRGLAALMQLSLLALPLVKWGLLIVIFFIAFFCFSMAIRYFNHVGYMINLSYENDGENRLFHTTLLYLNKAGRYYAWGNRAFYFSLPVILWFFGPYFLMAGTVILICGLLLMDYAPTGFPLND